VGKSTGYGLWSLMKLRDSGDSSPKNNLIFLFVGKSTGYGLWSLMKLIRRTNSSTPFLDTSYQGAQ